MNQVKSDDDTPLFTYLHIEQETMTLDDVFDKLFEQVLKQLSPVIEHSDDNYN